MLFDLQKCFVISKNALGSQKMLWGLKKMVDIVDTVEAMQGTVTINLKNVN